MALGLRPHTLHHGGCHCCWNSGKLTSLNPLRRLQHAYTLAKLLTGTLHRTARCRLGCSEAAGLINFQVRLWASSGAATVTARSWGCWTWPGVSMCSPSMLGYKCERRVVSVLYSIYIYLWRGNQITASCHGDNLNRLLPSVNGSFREVATTNHSYTIFISAISRKTIKMPSKVDTRSVPALASACV